MLWIPAHREGRRDGKAGHIGKRNKSMHQHCPDFQRSKKPTAHYVGQTFRGGPSRKLSPLLCEGIDQRLTDAAKSDAKQ